MGDNTIRPPTGSSDVGVEWRDVGQVHLGGGNVAVANVYHIDHVLVEGSSVAAVRVVQFDSDGVPTDPVSA
jgi:hypothetical protein